MTEKRTSAWLRETLCDEIERLREGRSDHVRAKGVAMLAREVLKSVEVEMIFRQQQAALEGTTHADMGTLPLCEQMALPAPDEPVAEQEPEEDEPQAALPRTDEPKELQISEVSGFKAGDRVFLPTGKHGTVKSVTDAGRINVAVDGDAGTFAYSAKHLSHAKLEREPIRSPVVPRGAVPRFVAGRAASGGRG